MVKHFNKITAFLCCFLIPVCLFLLFSFKAHSITPEEVPDPLKPWIGWVLEGEKTIGCPCLFNDADYRICAFPTLVDLDLNDKSGMFSQTWQVYRESPVALPGGNELWPQEITVNGQPARVIVYEGRAGVMLQPGTNQIAGNFYWSSLPEAITIPSDTGLVLLSVNGKDIEFPDIDINGRLWLKKPEKAGGVEKEQGDSLEAKVFRRIIDDIPMQVVTRIHLEVSGKPREELLGPAIFESFIPLKIQSSLPARLEPDGQIRVQLMPGTWEIELWARNKADLTSIKLKKNNKPWPDNEVWVFDAKNHIRLVEVEGVTGIDPHQTSLPPEWMNLPAYSILPGDTFKLKLIRRGDPQPAPDQLTLNRTMWLDFEGTGYTFQDRITGNMTKGWRLETGPEIQLGRALIDDAPQFITKLPGSEKQGVEVRRGSLNLLADLRYENMISSMPATGWDKDFKEVSAVLNLPPGWKLFSVKGVDNNPDTWVQKWSLMDLFLVLIAAVSFLRLWDLRLGIVSLLTLALIWHEPGSPKYVWLNILAAVALIKVLPEGRLKKAVLYYRNISFITLIIISIPFIISQVRNGLFPQLEEPFMPRPVMIGMQKQQMPMTEQMPQEAEILDSVKMRSLQKSGPSSEMEYREKEQGTGLQSADLGTIDPNAVLQTGPGIPQWKWDAIPFNWNGPVKASQHISLVLLSPGANLLLAFLRVILLLAISLFLFGVRFENIRESLKLPKFLFSVLIMFCVLMLSKPAIADFPSPELLKDLKTRLMSPPECLPDCAQIQRMKLNIEPFLMEIWLEIHATEAVAVPVPAAADQWFPKNVALNGAAANSLFKSDKGELYIQLDKGIHQVVLSGPLPQKNNVDLPLPLKPHHVTVTANGWLVKGVRENGLAEDQLQLSRIQPDEQKQIESLKPIEPTIFPPFVQVERILHFGLDWTVETRLTRISPPDMAAVIEVPLIAGESVTTQGIRVSEGKVLVNMSPSQRSMVWRSVLKKEKDITIAAPDTSSWIEVWRSDVSCIWHTDYSGISVIHHQDPNGRWLPEWHPWPGERITLKIIRPEGVKGQTITINSSRISVKPGRRATDTELKIAINSSQGGQHVLLLPKDAELEDVFINGIAQPVRQEGRKVAMPIVPGEQNIELSWRSDKSISNVFQTPEVDLLVPSVNHSIDAEMGQDRWVLWVAGPKLGPAVLFWGELIIILIISLGLGQIKLTPLKSFQWLLLGIGLSQTTVIGALLVVGWLCALGFRKNMNVDVKEGRFNLTQSGIVILTISALGSLFMAVEKGLLGMPEMQVTGNNSSAFMLHWFQDRVAGMLPVAVVLSVPLKIYRLIMLLWALWLAFSMVSWLKWGWQCFASNGIWKRTTLLKRKKNAEIQDPPDSNGDQDF